MADVSKGVMVTIGRRDFLRRSAAGAVALAAVGCGTRAAEDDRALARPEILTALGPGPVRAIGTQYRALTPAERDAAALRQAIHASRPWRARLFGGAGPSPAALVRDDFANGHVVVIDGWVLSVTEARQCALFSILSA